MYIVYKRRYINTLPFFFHLSLSASVWVLGHASHQIVVAIISSTSLSPTYQSARSFNVKCDTTLLHTFTCGVPRGSVHGILKRSGVARFLADYLFTYGG